MAWVSRDGLTAWVPDEESADCACGGDMATVHHTADCCWGPEQDGGTDD